MVAFMLELQHALQAIGQSGRGVGDSQPLVSRVRHVWVGHWPMSGDAQRIHMGWGGTGPWEYGGGTLSWERPPAGFDLSF